MKRLIALTVAAVMSLTFFSPCLQAAEWDTSKPPVSVIRQIVPERPSGDDDPFGVDKNQGHGFTWMNLISAFLSGIEIVWYDMTGDPPLAVGSPRGTASCPRLGMN